MAGTDAASQKSNDDIDSLFGDEDGDVDISDIFADDSISASAPIDNIGPSAETAATSDCSSSNSPHKSNPQYGLGWERKAFSLVPFWSVEPTIKSIIQTLRKRVHPDKTYHVKHWHDGSYNKFYLVSYENNHFVMKVSLPICPRLKTESEVATLDWVYRNTELPVPRVKCYDSTRDSPVGFEWILMSRVEGRPLSKCWGNIPEGSLHRIIKQIAQYATVAFNKRFNSICNIYPPNPGAAHTDPQPGPMVWMPFF